MSKTKREADGTFAKGSSGNPGGRPPKLKPRHRMPDVNREVAFAVAERPITIVHNGERIETSAYEGVLTSLARKAMAGHTPSARLFLDRVEKAAAVNGEHNVLLRYLFEECERLEKENERLRGLFPKTNGGVHILQPDGTAIPAAWQAKIRALEAQQEDAAEE